MLNLAMLGLWSLAFAAVDKPAWLEAPPRPCDGGYQFALVVGPYQTEVECLRELPARLQEKFNDYVELVKLQCGLAGPVELALPDELRSGAQRDLHRETLETTLGPMQRLHVRVVFDAAAGGWVRERLQDAAVTGRVWRLGVGLSGLLAVLAAGWLWLKR